MSVSVQNLAFGENIWTTQKFDLQEIYVPHKELRMRVQDKMLNALNNNSIIITHKVMNSTKHKLAYGK